MGEIGPWTDVYALGALMWRMVAGGCPDDSRLHVPDGADAADGAEVWSPTPREVEKRAYAMNRGRADPMPSAVTLGYGRFSRRLLEAIDKSLALYPEDRIQNCEELRVLHRAQATPEGARQKEDSQPKVGAHKTDQDGLSSIRGGVIRAISIVAFYLTINGLALNGTASRVGEPATAEQWGSLIGESLILGAITFTIATVFHWSLGRAAFFRPRRGWIAWLVVAGAFSGWNGAADGGALYAATLATLTAVFGAIIWAAIFILLGMFWRGLTRLMAPRSQDYESPSTPRPEATTSSSSRTNRANALYFVTLYGSLAVGVSVIAFGTLTSFEFFSDTNTVSDDELTSQQLIPITIVTEPSDAVVELPNRRVVYVPGMELPEGSYYVRVSAPGYEPRTQFLVHSARPQEHVIVLEPLRQAFTVEAIPSGARVRILNIVPIYEPGIMLSAGSYRVEVSASGYETVTETVWHDIAEPTIHQVELPRIGTQFPPIVATAEPNMLQSFTIEVEPLDARVQLLGTSTEYEPGMMLSAGNYRVEVSAPGHETVIETVPHNAASPTVHRVELSLSVAQMPENGRGTGTLEPGDYELDSGAYSDLWTVQAQAGQTLIVDLTSPDFDALLMLIDTRNSELVAEDDDSGVETDARIRLDLTEDGEYLIVASSYAAGEIGDYELRVDASLPLPASEQSGHQEDFLRSASFTRRSHEDDVLRVQGTPTEIDVYPASGYEVWSYGRSTVQISASSRRVTEWANRSGNLSVRLEAGTNITNSTAFTRGSHEDDVIRLQGTPTEIDVYSASGYEVWSYGRSTVQISASSRRVTEWANRAGNLRVR